LRQTQRKVVGALSDVIATTSDDDEGRSLCIKTFNEARA
jgi:hypothetical protein